MSPADPSILVMPMFLMRPPCATHIRMRTKCISYPFCRNRSVTHSIGKPHRIASYTSSPGVPNAWAGWTFWQYNDNGQLPGIAGNVDVDYFQGTENDLKALCF
jgi:GH25 family lysozyme M1 (1,4-beta-N-acetylmuramidase)